MIKRLLLAVAFIFCCSFSYAGDTTTNGYFYLPSYGASGAAERAAMYSAMQGTDVVIKALVTDDLTDIKDSDFTSNGLMKRSGSGSYSIITDNSSNWDTAYGWGNHSSAGYATSLDGLSDIGSTTQGAGRILVSDGTDFNSVEMSGDCTIGATGTMSCTGTGGGAEELVDLTDVGSATATVGKILVGDGDTFESVSVSGDATLAATGALTIANNAVALGTDTTGNYVSSATASQGLTLTGTEGASLGLQACTDGQILKNSSGTSWVCGTDNTASAGSLSFTDLSDVGATTVTAGRMMVANGSSWESVAVSGDVTMAASGAVAIQADSVALGTDTTGGYAASVSEGGPATTATALAANGANCSAGQYPLGVDASGAAEGCTDAVVNLTDLSDVGATTATGGRLLVADGDSWESVAMSGSCTLAASGAIDCGDSTSNRWGFNVSNPAVFYADTDHEVLIEAYTGCALTVSEIRCTCDANPTTEITADLKFADAFIGMANATVIDAVDTTDGATAITSGFDDATVPAGKAVYLSFDTTPDSALLQFVCTVRWTCD